MNHGIYLEKQYYNILNFIDTMKVIFTSLLLKLVKMKMLKIKKLDKIIQYISLF